MGAGTLVGASTDTKTVKIVAEGTALREAAEVAERAAVAVGVGIGDLETLGKVNPPVTGPPAAASATPRFERIERYPTVAENPQTLPFPVVDENKELSSQSH